MISCAQHESKQNAVAQEQARKISKNTRKTSCLLLQDNNIEQSWFIKLFIHTHSKGGGGWGSGGSECEARESDVCQRRGGDKTSQISISPSGASERETRTANQNKINFDEKQQFWLRYGIAGLDSSSD